MSLCYRSSMSHTLARTRPHLPLTGNWEISLTASFATNSKPHTENNVTLFKIAVSLCVLQDLCITADIGTSDFLFYGGY